MTQTQRPPEITAILEKVIAEYPADMVATLEAYLADLEARQPDQLAAITTILKTIIADLPLDASAALIAYVARLEAGQQPAPVEPESIHWRLEKRAEKRRERALRKLRYTQ